MNMITEIQQQLRTFEEINPHVKSRARLTSGSRTWQSQLDIILQPKRKNNYVMIKARFLKAFKVPILPGDRLKMSGEELRWWEREIMKQAGKSPGFPHIGGKAQDISVRKLSLKEKRELEKQLKGSGFKVLREKVNGTQSDYNVPLMDANVFHVVK